MTAGYCGGTADGLTISNLAGMAPLVNDASAICTTYAPRNTSVRYEKGQCRFRHTRLPAGRFLFYVRFNKNYLDWQALTIASAGAKKSLRFAHDPREEGDLRVNLRRAGGPYQIRLLARADKGRPPVSVSNTTEPGIELDLTARSQRIGGMKSGAYQLDLIQKKPIGSGAYVLTPVRSWTVRVTAGKERTYLLE